MNNPTKILLIGDEPNILKTLRRNLSSRGYEVAIALDDVEARLMTTSVQYDLFVVILDFTFDEINGLDICENLRKVSQAPLIVLSSLGSEDIKIKSLDIGADDYLVMPFSMDEFLARVRSALRRWVSYQVGSTLQENLILVGNILIDKESRQISRNGESLHLTPTEFNLLLYMAQRMGKVVTHRELLQSIWGTQYGDEREYLRVFISQIRRKIEIDPLNPKVVLTEPGVGYRFTSS